jgi:hypothetical protein
MGASLQTLIEIEIELTKPEMNGLQTELLRD